MGLKEYLPSIELPALAETDPGSSKLLAGWGDQLDQLAQRARDTARAALLDLCGDDALGAHGVNSGLERAKNETAAAFRAYLQTRFTRWWLSGTDEELVRQVQRLGYSRVFVKPWIELALAGNPGAFGGYTSFWYLQIAKPNPFTVPKKWGAHTGKWGDHGTVWGVGGVTPNELNEIRRIVRKWGPAGASCRFIELVVQVNIFGIPTRVVRIPVYEEWQRQENGAYYDLYNHGI